MKMESEITVEAFGITSRMTNMGKGKYPYDCQSKHSHPNSTIYQDDLGGWVPSHKLIKLPNGNYTIK